MPRLVLRPLSAYAKLIERRRKRLSAQPAPATAQLQTVHPHKDCCNQCCMSNITDADACWLPQLIQYAKHKGIKTINIVRRQEQVQQLKDLG